MGKALGVSVSALAGFPPCEPRLSAGRWADHPAYAGETAGCPKAFFGDLDEIFKALPAAAAAVSALSGDPLHLVGRTEQIGALLDQVADGVTLP